MSEIPSDILAALRDALARPQYGTSTHYPDCINRACTGCFPTSIFIDPERAVSVLGAAGTDVYADMRRLFEAYPEVYNRAGRGRSPWMLQRPGSRLASWYRVDNAAGKSGEPASVYLYDEIGMWGVSAQDFVDDFKAIRADVIDFHINSPGGEVYDGLAIHSLIDQHRAHIRGYVDGLAASAASFIFQACNERIVARNADMMIHDAMGACFGNAADMNAMVEKLAHCSDNIADIYAERAGGTVTEWRDRMRANNGDGTWYTGQAAVDAGLADRVAGEVSEEDLARASNWATQLGVFAMNRPSATGSPRGATGDHDPGPGAPGDSASPPSAESPALDPDEDTAPIEPALDDGDTLVDTDGDGPALSFADLMADVTTSEPATVPADINLGEIFRLTIDSIANAEAPAPDSPPVRAPEPLSPDGLILADALREVVL